MCFQQKILFKKKQKFFHSSFISKRGRRNKKFLCNHHEFYEKCVPLNPICRNFLKTPNVSMLNPNSVFLSPSAKITILLFFKMFLWKSNLVLILMNSITTILNLPFLRRLLLEHVLLSMICAPKSNVSLRFWQLEFYGLS